MEGFQDKTRVLSLTEDQSWELEVLLWEGITSGDLTVYDREVARLGVDKYEFQWDLTSRSLDVAPWDETRNHEENKVLGCLSKSGDILVNRMNRRKPKTPKHLRFYKIPCRQ